MSTFIFTFPRLVVTCDPSMTLLAETKLQKLGITFLYNVEELSIGIFFYGASSSLLVYGPSTSSIIGVFLALFSASVVIFMFVFFFPRVAYFLVRPDLTGGGDFLIARQRLCSS